MLQSAIFLKKTCIKLTFTMLHGCSGGERSLLPWCITRNHYTIENATWVTEKLKWTWHNVDWNLLWHHLGRQDKAFCILSRGICLMLCSLPSFLPNISFAPGTNPFSFDITYTGMRQSSSWQMQKGASSEIFYWACLFLKNWKCLYFLTEELNTFGDFCSFYSSTNKYCF